MADDSPGSGVSTFTVLEGVGFSLELKDDPLTVAGGDFESGLSDRFKSNSGSSDSMELLLQTTSNFFKKTIQQRFFHNS